MTPFRSLLIAMVARSLLIGAAVGRRGTVSARLAVRRAESRSQEGKLHDRNAAVELWQLRSRGQRRRGRGRPGHLHVRQPGEENSHRHVARNLELIRSPACRMEAMSLNYNIYLDATHRTVWGDGVLGTDVYFENNPPNGTPVIVPAYGRIPARQDPDAGTIHRRPDRQDPLLTRLEIDDQDRVANFAAARRDRTLHARRDAASRAGHRHRHGREGRGLRRSRNVHSARGDDGRRDDERR